MVSVLSGGVPGFWAVPCVPVLADGPPGGFLKGNRLSLILNILMLGNFLRLVWIA